MTDTNRDPDFDQDNHPLSSPTELAGTTEGAIQAEFAAREAQEALADAEGAATGAELEDDSLPLDGE